MEYEEKISFAIEKINSYWNGLKYDEFSIHSHPAPPNPHSPENSSDYQCLAYLDYHDWHGYLSGDPRSDVSRNSLVKLLLSHLNKEREFLSYSICKASDCPLHCAQISTSRLTKLLESIGTFPFPAKSVSRDHFLTLVEFLESEPRCQVYSLV